MPNVEARMTKEARNPNKCHRLVRWCLRWPLRRDQRNYPRHKAGALGLRHSFVILVSTFVLSPSLGCGDSGPKMYELTGTVKYNGTPLPVGHIRFEPQQGVRTKDTVTQSLIKNGRYELKVTGGPHRVMIRDMAGEYDLPEVQNARSLFAMEYRDDIELPAADSVEDEPVTQDFDIPADHK
jgi:hypothetical protein